MVLSPAPVKKNLGLSIALSETPLSRCPAGEVQIFPFCPSHFRGLVATQPFLPSFTPSSGYSLLA